MYLRLLNVITLALIGLFTIYPRDSAAFLIETGGDAEEVMEAAISVVEIKDEQTKNLIRN